MLGRRLLSPLGGAVLFVAIAALAVGGLGWVTIEALKVEAAERDATARAAAANTERLALWQLDGRLFPAFGVENNRPYAHYFALSLQQSLIPDAAGNLVDLPTRTPSPLLTADLPDWMLLHFQLDPQTGWESPQVPASILSVQLQNVADNPILRANATPERRELLEKLKTQFPFQELHAELLRREATDPSDSTVAVPLPLPAEPMAAPGAAVETMRTKDTADAKAEAQAAGSGNPSQVAEGGRSNPGARGGPGRGEANNEQSLNARKGSLDKGLGETKPAEPTAPGPPAMGRPPAPARGGFGGGGFGGGFGGVPGGMPAAPPAAPAGPGGAGGFPAGGQPGGPPPAPKPDAKKEAPKAGEAKLEGFDAMRKQREEPAKAADAPADRRRSVSSPALRPPAVHLGPVRPHWLTAADGTPVLALARVARLESKVVFQGVVLDWPRLQNVLRDEIHETLPDAELLPLTDPDTVSDRRMATLPAALDPGPLPHAPPPGWTPLRLGLAIGWGTTLAALAAVGAAGRALIDLSERRIRFVSAVTHELRTPLTSLRIYLDLLTSGLVSDEDKRREYLGTLSTESERLNRLIENVLDFARLERRAVRAHMHPTRLTDVLDDVRRTWSDRLAADGKELQVVSTLPADLTLTTDPRMAAQVLGNLIDNARKYSAGAADPRVWVWAKPSGRRVALEVEDRGPGVSPADRPRVFRPFRRGPDADTTAGGAGLGLALAKQWAEAIGGRLTYRPADGGVGACFRLELPS